MNRLGVVSVFIVSGLAGFLLSCYHRPQPPAEINLEPDVQLIHTYHSPVSIVKQLKNDPDAGRKIFNAFCTSCHGTQPIIDINAPTIGDKKVWGALRKLGVKKLLELTSQGVKAMPARGGCFECSDKQLRDTIEYILRES